MPNDENLRKEILEEFQETENLGVCKNYSNMARYVYWRRMFEDFNRFLLG